MVVAALVIGIVALVVSLLTAFRPILGKPEITTSFSVHEAENGRVLQGEIYNYPITNKRLRLLGVRRMVAEDIMAHLSIKEHGSDRVVFPGAVPHIISYTGSADAQRISLAPSPFPARFGIVVAAYAERSVKVYEEDTTLPVGVYCACVHITVEGESVEAQRDFVVTDKHPFTYWQGVGGKET
jgi:hypothetical protein